MTLFVIGYVLVGIAVCTMLLWIIEKYVNKK